VENNLNNETIKESKIKIKETVKEEMDQKEGCRILEEVIQRVNWNQLEGAEKILKIIEKYCYEVASIFWAG
jgi:hypothetical protein